VCPFISVETGDVIDSDWSKRYIRTVKSLCGNEIKHWMKQLEILGLLPNNLRWLSGVVSQTYKGNVTIVPNPTFKDYANLLTNVTPEEFKPAIQI